MAYGGWRGLHLEQLLIHVVRRAQPPGVQSQAPTVQRVHLLLSDWLPDGVQNCQQADEIRRKERKEKGGRDGRRDTACPSITLHVSKIRQPEVIVHKYNFLVETQNGVKFSDLEES